MERMNLNDAELTVTTQHLLDTALRVDYEMTLSDFGDMQEFMSCCSGLFPDEKAPQYRYIRWENIPSIFITSEWLCPNFFDVREAMDQLGDDDTEFFEKWCHRYGYDLRTENPYQLVAHFRNIYGDAASDNAEIYLPETDDDSCSYACYPEGWFDRSLLKQEIFDDNYD